MITSLSTIKLAPWVILAGLSASTPALSQVQDLGSTFDRSSSARMISADGRVVAGFTLFISAFTEHPFRFTDAGGFELLPSFNGHLGAPIDISDDGTYIAGNVGTARAVRWTETNPPLVLAPGANCGADAISGDGSTIVGVVDLGNATTHAMRWTESGGLVDIHPSFTPTNFNSRAGAVSQDGSVVAGYVYPPTLGVGFLPQAFVWTAATGAIHIGLQTSPDIAAATSVSDDGSVVVGRGRFGTQRLQPFVWTAASGMIPLGEIGESAFMDVTVSDDGSTIFGACDPEGFRWTQAGGMQVFSGSSWFRPTSATPDGETLVGYVESSGPSFEAATWTAAAGVTLLPGSSSVNSAAFDLSADGSSIVGQQSATSGQRAVRWRSDGTIGVPYCDPAVANSASATGAYLSLRGSNQAAEQALEFSVVDLPPNSFGYFLTSRARGLSVMPGGSQGTLCLGGTIGRFVGHGQILNSGSQGTFSLTVDPGTIPSPSGPVLPSFGETWHFQAWYRDANPTATSNFSSAASVPIY